MHLLLVVGLYLLDVELNHLVQDQQLLGIIHVQLLNMQMQLVIMEHQGLLVQPI